MPKVSKDSATGGGDHGPVVEHSGELGQYTATFLTFRADVDVTPLLRGLPDDRCHCPHWGYVIKGSVTFRFADRDEVFEAGDAFAVEPGHSPIRTAPGTELIQISPTEPLREVSEAIARNLAAGMQPA